MDNVVLESGWWKWKLERKRDGIGIWSGNLGMKMESRKIKNEMYRQKMEKSMKNQNGKMVK